VQLDGVLRLGAEIVGFVSSAALAQQAYRLTAHQETAKELRHTAEQQARNAPSLAERAQQSARALDGLISRWDKVDQRLVFVGLLGLVASFALKLLSMLSEP
jgi:hypothetical protein